MAGLLANKNNKVFPEVCIKALILHVSSQKEKLLQAAAGPYGAPWNLRVITTAIPIRMHKRFLPHATHNPGRSFCTAENCRRAMLLAHFGERLPHGACSGCDVCRDPAAVARQVSTLYSGCSAFGRV